MRHVPTANIALDTRKPKGGTKKEIKNGETIDISLYPVKIRITCARKSRFFQLNKDYYFTRQEFETFLTSKKGEIIEARRIAQKKLEEANRILDEIRDYFSFEEFKRIYNSSTKSFKDVYSVFEEYIQLKKDEGQFATATSYNEALKALKRYKKNLYFREITPVFLKKFEQSFENKNTVGIYLRPLRAVYNYAIVKKIANRDDYPFNKYSYIIPKTAPRDLALNIDVLKPLFQYQQKHFEERADLKLFALDMFIFSYLCCGINFADIARLKHLDIINDEYFMFIRNKTKNTTSEIVTTPIYLNTVSKAIIKRHSNPFANIDDYVFPIIQKGLSEEMIVKKINEKRNRINKRLKLIAHELNIEGFSTYAARHSFATNLRNENYSYDDIGDMMSHLNTEITKGYVDKAKLEKLKKASEDILKTIH